MIVKSELIVTHWSLLALFKSRVQCTKNAMHEGSQNRGAADVAILKNVKREI